MSRPRAVSLSLAVAFLAVAVAVLVWRLAQRDGADNLLGQTRQRIDRLKVAVEEQRSASERAVAEYKPQVRGTLDDLTTSAEALLRQLPGVAQVEVAVAVPRPSTRIVHLRDWHHVPRDLYTLDARQVYGRKLTEQELDALHEEHLLQVELVQLEQGGAAGLPGEAPRPAPLAGGGHDGAGRTAPRRADRRLAGDRPAATRPRSTAGGGAGS